MDWQRINRHNGWFTPPKKKAVPFYADVSGGQGYTVRGVVDDFASRTCSSFDSPLAADPLTCPCGAGFPGPAFSFEPGSVVHGCRRPVGLRSAEFGLRVAVESLEG